MWVRMANRAPNPAYHIGREYIEAESLPGKANAQAAARTVARINDRLYERIPVPVRWTENDPYGSFEEMQRRVKEEEVFYVFSGGTHPPHLTREENIRGRAVHDWFGHLDAGVDFSLEGEYKKWKHVRSHYPPETWNFLFAEVVGQLCAAIYLPEGFESDRFTQRTCTAPARWVNAVAEHVDG